MCGAASESILLEIAITSSTEEAVIREYLTSSGRSRIEKKILSRLKNYYKREFTGYLSLLKYWRDNSSHGRTVNITEDEAYTSLAIILRMSQFTIDHWERLCTIQSH
jgi:hypothetical protein